MKSRFLARWFAVLLGMVIAAPALCSVTYNFEFTNLKRFDDSNINDFNITLNYSDYVVADGLALLQSSLITSLGYTANYGGTSSSLGWWMFDNDGTSFFDSNNAYFSDLAFLVTLTGVDTYITAAGDYWGSISGNAPDYFFGSAHLNVSESATSVPESNSIILFAIGICLLVTTRRQRS